MYKTNVSNAWLNSRAPDIRICKQTFKINMYIFHVRTRTLGRLGRGDGERRRWKRQNNSSRWYYTPSWSTVRATAWEAIERERMIWRCIQGDPSEQYIPPVDLGLGSYGSWWAATVATYFLGRMAGLTKSKSMVGFYSFVGSPCSRCARHNEAVTSCMVYRGHWKF